MTAAQLTLPGLGGVPLAEAAAVVVLERLEDVCASCGCTADPRRGVCRCRCHVPAAPALRRAG